MVGACCACVWWCTFPVVLALSSDRRSFDEHMTGQGWGIGSGPKFPLSVEALKGANTWMGEDGRDADVLNAAEGLLTVSPAPPASRASLTRLLQRAAQWDREENGAKAVPVSEWLGSNAVYVGFAYDALQAIARAVDEEIRAGGDAADGTALMRRLLNGTAFDGVMGRVSLDENGDNLHPW